MYIHTNVCYTCTFLYVRAMYAKKASAIDVKTLPCVHIDISIYTQINIYINKSVIDTCTCAIYE